MISVVAGVILRSFLSPPLYVAVGLLILTLGLSVWRREFLFAVIGLASFINIHQRAVLPAPGEDQTCNYICVVTAEDQRESSTKLSLDVKRAFCSADTVPLGLPADFYLYSDECLLGKTLLVKGRLRASRILPRPNLLSGQIRDRDLPAERLALVFGSVARHIDRLFRELFNETDYDLASGLVLGGSSRVGRDLREVFTQAGVLHILSVSGLHVGFLITFVGLVLLVVPISPKVKFMLVAAAIFIYAGITGFRPSVLRAALMAVLFGGATVLQRHVDSRHILNVSALVILILDPLMLFDIGAQLSFASVYGILLLYPRLQSFIAARVPFRSIRFLLTLMALSFCAQLFVSPLLIQYFHRTQLVALVSNVVVVPLTSLITYLLFACIIISPVLFSFARIAAGAASLLLDGLVASCNFFSALPFASLNLSLPAVFSLLFYFLFSARCRRPAVYAIIFCSMVFSLSALYPCLMVQIAEGGCIAHTAQNCTIRIAQKNDRYTFAGAVACDYSIGAATAPGRSEKNLAWPKKLRYKKISLGDTEVMVDTAVWINFGAQCIKVDPRLKQKNAVHYVFTDGRKRFDFQAPATPSLLDRIVLDLKVLWIKLRLFL